AYVELALVKMMEHKTLKSIDQEASIIELKQSLEELKEQMKTTPKTMSKSDKKELVNIKQVELILNNNDKEKKNHLQSGWAYLKDYPKSHLKMAAHLLYQSELEAVSNHMLIVFDDLNQCKRIMEPEVKQQVIEIINNKQQLIDDYIAILKTDWLIIKEVYLDLWKKGQKKPKLPPYDFKLYIEELTEEKKEPEVISLARDYFGEKINIKE
ncbi:MAG: hypothetical protein IH571_01070, partial [Acholeplasmataceae bacterium]|nr:hypothetical protein [Acholeplasmataceae bacterium]